MHREHNTTGDAGAAGSKAGAEKPSWIERLVAQHMDLRALGYVTTPDCGKKCFLEGWSEKCPTATEDDIRAWLVAHPQWSNIGIMSIGVKPVDIDVDDNRIAKMTEDIVNKAIGPSSLVRYGRAPRRLLLYRCQSAVKAREITADLGGTKLSVQILSAKFTAFGVHPDTGKDYIWLDKSPLDFERDELEPFGQVAELDEAAEQKLFDSILAMWRGLGALTEEDIAEFERQGGEALGGDEAKDPKGLALAIMAFLKNDFATYAEWRDIGQALWNTVDQDGYGAWVKFSSSPQWPRNTPKVIERMWKSFQKPYAGRKLTYKFLLRRALDQGFTVPPEFRSDQGMLDIIDTAGVRAQPIAWLWWQRFAIGKISLIGGYPSAGKSLVTIDIASRVRRGADWPDGNWLDMVNRPDAGTAPQGSVIIMTVEDDPADTIKPRLLAAGGGNAHVVRSVKLSKGKRRGFDIMGDLPLLEREIARIGDVVLLIIDPLSGYMGQPGKRDTWKDSDVRATLMPLAEMSAKRQIAVIGIMHFGKEAKQSALASLLGSVAFGALARTAYVIVAEKDEQGRDTGGRLFLVAKAGIAKKITGLAFKVVESETGTAGIRAPRIQWESGDVHMTADDYLREVNRDRHDRACEAFLNALLGCWRVPSDPLERWARERGFSERRVKKARVALGVEVVFDAERRQWLCSLPEEEVQGSLPGMRKEKPLLELAPGETWESKKCPI
jgi:hypothetical protein